MKTIVSAALVAATGILFASPFAARAADAQFCFGDTVTYSNSTNGSATSTQTFPQISNATKFTCRTQGVQYTIADLAMRGFNITPMGDLVLSITTSISGQTGTTTVKQRSQILIQK